MIIVFEGIPGSGVTTTINNLVTHFQNQGRSCQVSSVDSYPLIIERARSYPYASVERNVLFWIARVHHDAHVALLASQLAAKELLFVDRLWGSLLAYDFLLRFAISESDQEFWKKYPESFATQPDLVILIDTPVEIAKSHKNTPGLLDPIVAERVRQRYLELAFEHQWRIVDGRQSIEWVTSQCIRLIRLIIDLD